MVSGNVPTRCNQSPPLQGEGWVGMVFKRDTFAPNTIPIPAFPLKGKEKTARPCGGFLRNADGGP
jgi:hypothetical protein